MERHANPPLEAVVAHTPVAMAVFDTEMRYIAVSERWLTDYRLDCSPLGRLHYDVFPEISEAWKAVHRRCLAGATESSEGDPFPRADGRVQWVKWKACPWRDSGGSVGGIILTTEDITARKEVEAEAARLAWVVEHANDAIIAKTLDSIVTSWNPGATRLLGYRAEEMIGQSIARVIPAERLAEEDRILAQLRAGNVVEHFETQRIAKDGSVLDVSLSISPIRDERGTIVGASKIMRDITERRRSEALLRASEERFRLLVEEAPDAIVLYDVDQGRMIAVNKAAERLYGVSRDEILRQGPLRFYAPEQPDGRPGAESFAEHIKRALAGEEVTYDRRIRRPSGEERLCRATVVHLPSQVHLVRASLVDITEQDRARRELAATAAILAAEHESSPDGILVIDTEARIVSSNRRFAEIFDIPHALFAAHDDESVLSQSAGRTLDPEALVRRVQQLHAHPEESAQEEIRLKDGRVLDRHTSPFRTADGEMMGRIWYFRDITERLRAQATLRASEERFRMLIEEAPDAILIGDEQGFIVAVNKAAESLFGAPRQTLLGDGLKGFYAPEQPDGRPLAETFQEHNLRALAGEVVHYHRRIFRPSGDVRHCRATLVRIESDPVLLRASYVDVTEQRVAEESLRASEERFRTLFEEAPDAIVIIDFDPVRTLAVNKATERLVGLSRDEILRREPLSFYSSEQPDARPAAASFAEHIERAIAGEEVTFERRIRRPSGEDRLCRVTIVRLRSSISLFRVSLVDITEQRAAEAKLSEAMLSTVRRQEHERQRIARELHDTLGQYLAGMTMNLDALGRSAPDASPLKSGLAELKGLTATVGSEMRRLAWELRPAALDDLGLEPAIERFAEEWARRSGLAFDLDCKLNGRRLPADVETALYRVLQEGVTNIVKHASARRIGVVLKMMSDSVVMILEDDGKGFDPETVICGSNRRFGLLGMRERLALIGGALEIESTPGAGTTLIIRAPLGDTVTSS